MTWNEFNNIEKQKEYFPKLQSIVAEEYKTHTCYPPSDQIFNAIKTTNFEDVKCVILGQDPYHGTGQAMGLSFSVNKNISIPPSLKNIYKELQDELGCYIPNNGDLTSWAKQGVLLLNAFLTVRAHEPASHRDIGWETYTDNILIALNKKDKPVVFMLWGAFARKKASLITDPKHLVLECPHPSPYSANSGFFGCDHFKKCNEFLEQNNLKPINWQIENI